MSRYIDADVLCEAFTRFVRKANNHDYEPTPNWNDAISIFHSMPTVYAVEVVRCKDCMHTEIDKYAPAECQNRCKLSHQYHEPNFFCKCGEPRTDLLEWIHKGDADVEIH